MGHRPRHWVYLDQARTHEVHAQVDVRPTQFHLAITEFPAGSRDPAEALVEERQLESAAEVRTALGDLEQRLALAAAYQRADLTDLVEGATNPEDLRWSPVAAPADPRRVDLRAFDVPLPGGDAAAALRFHHFHSSQKGRDALLVQVPRQDLAMPRAILAQLDFDFPRVDQGELKVLHTRLAPGTLRSVVVRQHIDLPARGYAKLVEPTDYERTFGVGWVDRARDVFRRAAARVFDIAPAAPPPPPAAPLPTLQADRLAHALQLPKLRELRDRHVPPPEAEALFQAGELAIRKFVQVRRRRADHHTMFEPSLVESLLLVEYGLRRRDQALLDQEGAKLLRYVAPRSSAGAQA